MHPELPVPITVPNRIRVLHQFDPVLRILKAYNVNNFFSLNWRSLPPSVFHAFHATLANFGFLIFIVLTAWKVIENGVDMEKLVVSVPILLSLFWVESVAVDMIWNNGSIIASIDRLGGIINQRISESEQSQRIYEQVEYNQASRVVAVEKVVYVAVLTVFLLPASIPLSYILFGFPSPQLWALPVRIHSLLGQTTYLGFYVDWLIEVNALSVSFTTVSVPIFIYVGIFLYIHAMVGDINTRLMAIDEFDQQRSSNRSNQRRTQSGNQRVWSIYMQEFAFHHNIICIAKSLCSTMEITLFGITLTCIIDIALDLYGLELIAKLNFDAFVAVIILFFATAWTFVFFCLSEWMTMDMIEIGEHFYNSPWYRVLSAKEQRLLTFAIQQAQCEIRLKGLGLFDGSLTVFASILRTAASYFIIIRRFK